VFAEEYNLPHRAAARDPQPLSALGEFVEDVSLLGKGWHRNRETGVFVGANVLNRGDDESRVLPTSETRALRKREQVFGDYEFPPRTGPNQVASGARLA